MGWLKSLLGGAPSQKEDARRPEPVPKEPVEDVEATKLFTAPLAVAAERSDPHGLVPSPIRVAVAWLNEHALEEEGLYRIPGSLGRIREYKARFDRGEEVQFDLMEEASTVSGVLTHFFRDLPGSVFTHQLYEPILACRKSADRERLVSLLRMLPPCHIETLRVFIGHLAMVASHADVNRMTPENIAVCLFPMEAGVYSVLIEYYHEIFTALAPAAAAPTHATATLEAADGKVPAGPTEATAEPATLSPA